MLERIRNVIGTKKYLAEPLAPTCSLDGQAGPKVEQLLCGGLLHGGFELLRIEARGGWVLVPSLGPEAGTFFGHDA